MLRLNLLLKAIIVFHLDLAKLVHVHFNNHRQLSSSSAVFCLARRFTAVRTT